MVNQAIIIAGGLGSRLIKNGVDTPKPLLEIDGKSLIEWQVINLEREGIDEIVLLLGLNSTKIINHVNTIKNRTSINFHFIIENSPLGTGGALLNALDFLHETFLVLYGDLLVDTGLKKLFNDAKGSEYGSIGVRPSDHPLDSDLVGTNLNYEISRIYPKPNSLDENRMNLAMTGVMCLNKKFLTDIENTFEYA
jgi:NDP-sugar pyrophosphorylase family protein